MHAASWKAFNDRLGQMNLVEPPTPPPEPAEAMPMKPPQKKDIPKGKQARRPEKKK